MPLSKTIVSSLRPVVERFPKVASVYRNIRDQLAFDAHPVKTKWGFTLVGNRCMAAGDYEPEETNHIRTLLRDVDVFVNVGANIGYYCCHALSLGKTVIAFEPIMKNLKYLYLNITNNGWRGVEVYPMALSNKVGITKIFGSDTGASLVQGWAGIPENFFCHVPTSTLDLIIGERLRGKKVLILVDVEGVEKSLLEGASRLLASEPKPIWMVEITTNENSKHKTDINSDFKATFDMFFQQGYEAFEIKRNIQPVTQENINIIAEGKREASTYNYLFQASE